MVSDEQFFAQHPDRFARIRAPQLTLVLNRQRSVASQSECEREFLSLGEHKLHRRRIILWRMPNDNLYYDPEKPQILKIPFLLFSDEEVADTDDILLPIIHSLMVDEARKQRII